MGLPAHVFGNTKSGRVVAPDGSSRPDNPTKRRPFGRGGKVALPAALTDTYTSAAEPNTDADGER